MTFMFGFLETSAGIRFLIAGAALLVLGFGLGLAAAHFFIMMPIIDRFPRCAYEAWMRHFLADQARPAPGDRRATDIPIDKRAEDILPKKPGAQPPE